MRRGRTAALLAGVLAGLLLGGCSAGNGQESPPAPTGLTATAEASRPEGRRLDAIRRAAGDAVEVVLSYDHRTLDADEAAAVALMTPDYANAFRDSFARLRAEATGLRGSSRAVAVDTAVVSATRQTVRVLVFVDQTTRAGQVERSAARIAPVVTMERLGGAWRVADIATGAIPGEGSPTPLEASATSHAERTAEAYLTLSWETIAEDLLEVQELIGGELAQQYADGADALVEAVRARRTLQEPRVLAVGLSSLDQQQATALVSAVVTTTHQATGSSPTQEGRRLWLRLERDGAGWVATRLRVVD